jgi:peptidoglycan/LPS O-acetylase OafA/YrhL
MEQRSLGRPGLGAGRLIFANQLRGVAALGVAASHLIGVYWLMQPVVSAVTSAPEQSGARPAILALVSLSWFNFGPFGVGLFFLISGLVIPISLHKHSRGSFLLTRALRIYPICIAALAVDVAMFSASALYWGHPVGLDWWMLLGNGLLIYNYTGQPSFDLVNWTLCIEIKFYLLMALLAWPMRRGSVVALFAVALVLLGVDAAIALGWVAGPAAQAFSGEALYLIFMLIGVLFSFHLHGQLGRLGLALSVIVMTTIFVVCYRVCVLAAQYPGNTLNYLYALALFGTLFALRDYARPFWPLDAMAAISFPFYLVHSILGFTILRVLMVAGHVAYMPALAVAFASVVLVATGLHWSIETWTVSLGRLLSRAPTRGWSAAADQPSILEASRVSRIVP